MLLAAWVIYSCWVYTSGTMQATQMTDQAIRGKELWQSGNCQNCHQLFGLGGYMGPDLTTVTTDKHRGAAYAKGILMSGGNAMPDFHFNEDQASDLIAYLDYVSQASHKNND